MAHPSKTIEAPDDLIERDRIIMQVICEYNYPSMSLYDLGFGGSKWAKAFARVRKRFSIKPALGRKRYYTPDEKTKEMMREAMSDGKTIRITRLQYTVLRGLSSGAVPSDTLANSLKLPRTTVMSMVRKLRECGLARQRHISGKLYLYELTEPYTELEKKIIVSDACAVPKVSDAEARYYAILRNSGLTGQHLFAQFCKMFPYRSANGIASNVRNVALKRGWCR